MKVRIAFTSRELTFTPRGKSTDFHSRGFVRFAGKTISGVAWNSGPEYIFYAEGINKMALYTSQKEAA